MSIDLTSFKPGDVACTACEQPYEGLRVAAGADDSVKVRTRLFVLCRFCGHIMVAHVPTRTLHDLSEVEKVLLRQQHFAAEMRRCQEAIVSVWWG